MSRVYLGDLDGERDIRLACDGFLQDLNPGGAASMLFNLADVMSEQGPRAALPYYVEAIELPERFGLDGGEVWVGRAGRLDALAKMGRFDEVERETVPILEWAEGHDDVFTRFTVLSSLALVDIARGRGSVDPAELADLALRMDNYDGLARAAWLASECGDDERAGSVIDQLAPHALLMSAPLLSRVCVRLNRPEVARQLLARSVAYYPAQQAAVHAATAILAEADGDFQTASSHYIESIRTFEDLGTVPDEAYAQVGLGRCLLAQGETEAALARLTSARELWEGLGASARVEETDALLVRAPRR
jgi:tetratricopeptide (TPR) repeat protein